MVAIVFTASPEKFFLARATWTRLKCKGSASPVLGEKCEPGLLEQL